MGGRVVNSVRLCRPVGEREGLEGELARSARGAVVRG